MAVERHKFWEWIARILSWLLGAITILGVVVWAVHKGWPSQQWPSWMESIFADINGPMTAMFLVLSGVATLLSHIWKLLLMNIESLKSLDSMQQAATDIRTDSSELKTTASSIQTVSKEIQDSQLNAVSKAVGLIEKFAPLKLSPVRTSPNHTESSQIALEAVSCNLRKWEDQISAHFERGSSFLTEVWLRSQAAYFLEEGYDVGKKVLATNARNLCFVLLATLDALIEECGDKKVCYTAVTPVNPKDWYNWPHGEIVSRNDRKSFYENFFIGDYYRVLRELVKSHGDKLVHNRYILCNARRSDEDGNPQPFGWKLDTYEDLSHDLNGMVLPISVPNMDKFCNGLELHDYLLSIRSKLNVPSARLNDEGQVIKCSYFIPQDLDLNETKDVLSGKKTSEIDDLVAKTTNHHKSMVVIKIKKILSCINKFPESIHEIVRSTCSGAVEILKFSNLDSDNRKKILRWLTKSHDAEAQIAGTGYSHILQSMREHLLRCLDQHYINSNDPRLWRVFEEQLHSGGDCCHVAKVTDNDIQHFFTGNHVQPEFHLFGYIDKDGNQDWKLAVTATLSYPFEVTKLALYEDDGSLERYRKTLEFLSNGCLDNHGNPIRVSNPVRTSVHAS